MANSTAPPIPERIKLGLQGASAMIHCLINTDSVAPGRITLARVHIPNGGKASPCTAVDDSRPLTAADNQSTSLYDFDMRPAQPSADRGWPNEYLVASFQFNIQPCLEMADEVALFVGLGRFDREQRLYCLLDEFAAPDDGDLAAWCAEQDGRRRGEAAKKQAVDVIYQKLKGGRVASVRVRKGPERQKGGCPHHFHCTGILDPVMDIAIL